ncbi:MAG: universal stress protein [Cyclobacteriaceae bacterium]|nr:universal stress protein [Cyclobacteriaceae bacterium]
MKAILCALDFSSTSGEALKEAMKLANSKQSRLTVLYAYRLLQPKGTSVAEYRKQEELKASLEFDLLLKNNGAEMSVPVEFIIEIGFLSDRIESHVNRNKVECLVLSEQLASTIKEQQGLSFEHFMASHNIPVVIVPEALEVS